MTGISLAVIGRFCLSLFVVATGLAALVSVAAFADGRAPDPRRLGQVIGGFAPAVAAVWVLLDLRRHQEDVALASQGIRPAWIAALLLICAAPGFAVDQPRAERGIEATADRLTAPGLTIEWRDGVAHRPDAAPFEGLPAPAAMPSVTRNPWYNAGWRVFALALGLLGLLAWREPPGLLAGLAVAGLVFWAGT